MSEQFFAFDKLGPMFPELITVGLKNTIYYTDHFLRFRVDPWSIAGADEIGQLCPLPLVCHRIH